MPKDVFDPEIMDVHQRLRAVIEEFNAKCHGAEGVLTGFVLFTSSMGYDEDGDALFREDYSVGLGTDLTRAVGMVEICYMKLKRDLGAGHCRHCHDHEEDGDHS